MKTTITPEQTKSILKALESLYVRPFESKSCDAKALCELEFDLFAHYKAQFADMLKRKAEECAKLENIIAGL